MSNGGNSQFEELGRAAGRAFAAHAWNPRQPLTYSAVASEGRRSAEAAGITDSASVDDYAARFTQGYYDVVRPLEAQSKREQAQVEGLPPYLNAALYLRGFAVTAFVIGGILLTIGALIVLSTAISAGSIDSAGVLFTVSGAAALVVGWQISRHSKAALVVLAIAVFLFTGAVVIAGFSSSATVIILPIGFVIFAYRSFARASTIIDYVHDYEAQYGRLTIKQAKAQFATNPAYAFSRTMTAAQQKTRRRQLVRFYAIVGVVAAIIIGGVVAAATIFAPKPIQTTIPFAQSVAANLNINMTLTTDAHTQPNQVMVTVDQYLISDASETQVTHGEAWSCDGVTLTEDGTGLFSGIVPLLPATRSYRCIYQHGSDSTTLTLTGNAIPHIISPKDGATFTPDPVTGSYEVRWVPDKDDQVNFSAAVDGSTDQHAASGSQPDDGLYDFTITSFYSSATSSYDGPGTLRILRAYTNPAPQGFGAVQLTTSSTVHITWVPAPSDGPTPTPSI